MATNAEQIAQLYVGYLNRAPEPEGLNYWIGRLTDPVNPLTISQIANNFATQPETTALYPYLRYPNLLDGDTEGFITEIYQNLFNRVPEAEGLAYWTNQLESGAVEIGDFILTVIQSARNFSGGQDLTTLNNKSTVALNYATQVAQANAEWTLDSARASIKEVDSTAASVAAAEANIASFVENGAWPGDVGTTFTLTAATDTIVGTGGNDTVIGIVGTGATLNSLDSIDGGAGVNTLNLTVAGAAAVALPGAVSIKNIQTVNVITADAAGGITNLKSSYFGSGVESVWQVGAATSNITLSANDQVAGYRGVEAAKISGVIADAGVTSIGIAVESLTTKGVVTAVVDGANLTTLTVTGDSSVTGLTVTKGGAAGLTGLTTLNLELAGNGVVTLPAVADVPVLSTVDATTSTGNLTIDAKAIVTLESLTGGEGNDVLTVQTTGSTASNLAVNGGAGADTITVAAVAAGATAQGVAVSLTGGEGADTFIFSAALANVKNAATYSSSLITIEDFSAGDVVKFAGANTREAITGTQLENIAASKTLDAAITLAAGTITTAGNTVLFNYGNDVYALTNAAVDTTLNAGDGLVKIVGYSVEQFTSENLFFV